MFVKYVILMSMAVFGIMLYLHDYHLSSFSQLFTIYPQLHSTLIDLYGTVVFKWFDSGYSRVPRKSKDVLFTKEELQEYSESNKGLYLAILGKVYDVGKGEKFYASGGNYHFFTGRDGTRAFITGDFTDSGLTDDVTGLTVKELINLHEWAQYYHKEYKYKGKVIGRYYDDEGQPTSYYHQVRKLINKAKRTREEQDKEKLSYPPCNAEWSQESGSRVWCSTRSGGIERDWIGVPRQLYDPGSHTYRCICIRANETDGPNKKGNIKEYPECNPKSTSCWVHS